MEFPFSRTGVPHLAPHRRDDRDADIYHLPHEWLCCLGQAEIFALFTSTVMYLFLSVGVASLHSTSPLIAKLIKSKLFF